MPRDLIKNAFLIVAAMVLAILLYFLFFASDNSVTRYMCRMVEKPIAKYYYDYGYIPSVTLRVGLTSSLSSSYSFDYNDIETNLAGSASTDNTSDVALYSSGWY